MYNEIDATQSKCLEKHLWGGVPRPAVERGQGSPALRRDRVLQTNRSGVWAVAATGWGNRNDYGALQTDSR